MLDLWIEMGRKHWKEFRPTKYQALKAKGEVELNKALYQAAEMTADERDQLVEAGYNHQEAWEMTREKYLLLPPEEAVMRRLESED